MHLVPESDLAGLIRNLSKAQADPLLACLSDALTTYSRQQADPQATGPIQQPLRLAFNTADGNARLFMPAADAHTTGIKVVTVPRQGDIKATISLFNEDGSLRGLLSAAEITAFRTALASMTLLTKAREVSKKEIVIFGAGRQAEWHARLAVILFGDEVSKITFVNRSAGRLATMFDILSPDLRQKVPKLELVQMAKDKTPENEYTDNLRQALQNAAVIHCCTPSTEPLFVRADLGPNTKFISLIGSYKPHMQEIDGETLLSGDSQIFVDSKQACLEEAGEIIMAKVKEEQLTEIGGWFAEGHDALSVSSGSNIIFKCVGMGVMDLAVAQTLLELAIAGGIGQTVDGF